MTNMTVSGDKIIDLAKDILIAIINKDQLSPFAGLTILYLDSLLHKLEKY